MTNLEIYRSVIGDHINKIAPTVCHVRWSMKEPFDCDIRIKFKGWAQEASIYMKNLEPSFSWPATERNLAQALHFLNNATATMNFGAALACFMQDYTKSYVPEATDTN